MKRIMSVCLVATTMMAPVPAFADDPRDPAMRNADARARDSEQTRQLNLQASAAVRERGLQYEVRQRGASTDSAYQADYAQYAAASRDHGRDLDRYARDRAQYERDMAEWRRAVAACRAGYYEACGN